MARSSGEPKWSASFPMMTPPPCPVGAILLEQNAGCAGQRGRYMTPETVAPLGDDPAISFPAIAN